MRRQPFAVVLFDEVEKAHASVFNLLLQLLDEGRLTDATGTTADFTHTVIIMTSNLGARAEGTPGFGDSLGNVLANVRRAVEGFFSPELFNRIDRIVPFKPLSPETARRIAETELGKLLSRWGLTERSIFVACGEAPLAHVVAHGFDPIYGARTVKRYLENHVGALLAEEINRGEAASMRSFHLYVRDGRLRVHAEALSEAKPLEAPYAIAPLLKSSARELRELLPGTMDFLDGLLEGSSLSEISDEISERLRKHNLGEPGHAEALYQLESLRLSLRRLRGRVGRELAQVAPDKTRILSCLAEVEFFKRAIRNVRNTDQHSVFIKLSGIGIARAEARFHQPGQPDGGLKESLARAYASSRHAELEEAAGVVRGRTVVQAGSKPIEALLERGPDIMVLKIVGLSVLDYFSGETGCHLLRSVRRGTEVTRVQVSPAPPDSSAREELERHVQAMKAFSSALDGESGGLPENPECLLPAVREVRWEPARDEPGVFHVEDYLLGYAATLRARSLEEILPRLWTLRMSRVVSS